MHRFDTETQRLFGPADGPAGRDRALILELLPPADTTALGPLWRQVQLDLGLPAPAVAVSGRDGLQLWFSLQRAEDRPAGLRLLAALQARYLPEVPPAQLRLWPDGSGRLPAAQAGPEQWSAFIAPDLLPVFADTPWLDVAPSPDGQADLLAPLQSISPDALQAALQRLAPAAPAAAEPMPASTPRQSPPGDVAPRDFLQQVLNDPTAPLALRVEAAKALLGR